VDQLPPGFGLLISEGFTRFLDGTKTWWLCGPRIVSYLRYRMSIFVVMMDSRQGPLSVTLYSASSPERRRRLNNGGRVPKSANRLIMPPPHHQDLQRGPSLS